MNSKELGKWGEEQAKTYLEAKGYIVLEKNFRCPAGEIDIIARDGEWLVFVEVKTRRSVHYGYPAEAVDYRKQAKYIQAALYYLNKKKLLDSVYRFDIVEVRVEKQGNHIINHITNAFQPARRKYFF